MSGFDPGPGWRRVRADEYPETGLIRWTPDNPTDPEVYWVREEPLPMPTEPYTVIRVTDSSDPDLIGQILTGNGGGYWSNSGHTLGPASTARRISGFEVLAEPRAVTAEALMLRLETLREGDGENWREQILREFGVTE